jgi:predicted oxidoreductase
VDTELANTIRYSAQVLTEIKEQLISPLGEGDFFRGAERFVSLVDKIDDLERKVDALAAAQA